jgi:hypothetical protein
MHRAPSPILLLNTQHVNRLAAAALNIPTAHLSIIWQRSAIFCNNSQVQAVLRTAIKCVTNVTMCVNTTQLSFVVTGNWDCADQDVERHSFPFPHLPVIAHLTSYLVQMHLFVLHSHMYCTYCHISIYKYICNCI